MRNSPTDAPRGKKSLVGRIRGPARVTTRADRLGRLLRLETLEERTLLSASPTIVPVDNTLGDATFGNTASYQASSPSDIFYSPAWLSAAYGANSISFGATTGNGMGQTIVLVDAYKNPDITSDLTAFDSEYSIAAPPSFKVLNENGGTSLSGVPTDPSGRGPTADDWEFEEALDVEWAHAIAPDANIVLIEANSNNNSDLYTGVATAATLGTVVSMSWGTTEFSGENSNDSTYFSGAGVTYLAATGDNGNPGNYPAFSPNVVAVGGTDLEASSNGGNPPYAWTSETVWDDSGYGLSTQETEPSYQTNYGVQSNGTREIPDVVANAGVGVWIYDAYNNTNHGGDWFGFGGTSLSTPIWAGLVAIADQGRVVAEGGTALTGSSQTLPALYTAPDTDFRDANPGNGGNFQTGISFQPEAGLGSPIANTLVPSLAAYGEAKLLGVTIQPPSAVGVNSPFGLTVAAEDNTGTTDTSYTGTVTISLANNPGGSTLGGTLTATAVKGVATFTNLTLNELGTGYTLQATASGLTSTTTSGFNVTGPPVVTPSGTTNTFTVGGSAVPVDSGITVSSSDADITGATMTISAGTLQSGDTLNFTNQNGISGSYSGGILTLSGSATPAQYQTALQSVTFSTTSNITPTRSISVVAIDGVLDSSPAAESVKVVLAAPIVTPSGTTNTFTLGGAAVAVDSGVTVTSYDTDLTGATITISNYQSGDTLNFTNQNGIIVASNSAGVLHLTGSATPSQYTAALQSITFSTTSTNTTTRSLSIVAFDNSLTSNSAPEQVKVAIAAPVVTPSGVTNTFTIGSSAVAVDSGVTVTSYDTDLTGATVTISAGTLQSGDTLHFTNQNGISGNYSGGVLTLSGSATPAQYQTALQSVTFSTTSSNTLTRSLSIVAVDNALSSNAAPESVKVTFAAPVVTPSGVTNTFTFGGSAVAVDSGVTVTSNDADLTGATMTISAGTLQSGDTLNFINQIGITGNYSGGVLTLSGSATPAQYAAALQSVTFSTTSTNTTTRSLSIVAIDGSLNSSPAPESVKVKIVAPVVSTSGNTGQTFTLGGSAVAVDSGVLVTSSDVDLTGASMTIADYQSGDTLNFTPQNGITIASNSGGVLSLTGSATPAQYTAALQSVTFSTTSINQTTRTVDVVALDSAATPTTSNTGVDTVNVAIAPPVVASNQASVGDTAGQTISVDLAVTVQSFDTDVTGATMTIGTGYQPGNDTLNFTNQNGITGNYSAGVLTLSGSATPAQYQAALQSITFSSTSTSTTTRNISIVVKDSGDTGNVSSNTATTQIVVSPPVAVSAVYVSGSAWAPSFNTYLANNSLGSASYGYALQTGANQLVTLPWTNINQIDVQFSGPVNGIAQGSLELAGGANGSTPSVTGFANLGNNTYQWTLSGPLTNNRYVIGVASTSSSFGPAVVDSNGAGLSGTFTTGSSSFPSGNGLAGSTFDFFFNVLPGDVDRNAQDNPTDINDVRPLSSGTRTTSSSYNPYYDVLGAGQINATTLNTVRALTGRLESGNPIAPSDSQQVGTTGFSDLALGVQETGSSTSPAAGGVSASSSLPVNVVASSTPPAAATGTGSGSAGSSTPTTSATTSATSNRDHGRHQMVAGARLAATDVAVSAFDLADLWI